MLSDAQEYKKKAFLSLTNNTNYRKPVLKYSTNPTCSFTEILLVFYTTDRRSLLPFFFFRNNVKTIRLFVFLLRIAFRIARIPYYLSYRINPNGTCTRLFFFDVWVTLVRAIRSLSSQSMCFPI